jgi:hypothetical protein
VLGCTCRSSGTFRAHPRGPINYKPDTQLQPQSGCRIFDPAARTRADIRLCGGVSVELRLPAPPAGQASAGHRRERLCMPPPAALGLERRARMPTQSERRLTR